MSKAEEFEAKYYSRNEEICYQYCWNFWQTFLRVDVMWNQLVFFKMKRFSSRLINELQELDRITHAWIGFNYSLKKAQKTF